MIRELTLGALIVAVAAPAMAGTKTVTNTSGDTIKVTVVSRSGSLCTNNGPSASVTVGPNSSTTLSY